MAERALFLGDPLGEYRSVSLACSDNSFRLTSGVCPADDAAVVVGRLLVVRPVFRSLLDGDADELAGECDIMGEEGPLPLPLPGDADPPPLPQPPSSLSLLLM